jgi:Tetrapyrrole (Corrin/Porphyrin) Methylases
VKEELPLSASLTVVGTGIRTALHTTPEARTCIERAAKVLFLLDPVGARWIASLNASAETLDHLYSADLPRVETYRAMVDTILHEVRRGLNVCVALYGHPGVLVNPSHAAIRQARREGYPARMLPAISAEDCLVADLGVDPSYWGLHSYEATEFLLYRRVTDPSIALILWQVGAVGERRARIGPNRDALRLLADRLAGCYGPDHELIMYEASPYPIGEPLIARVRVGDLPTADVRPLVTIYVPPAIGPIIDPEASAILGVAPTEAG